MWAPSPSIGDDLSNTLIEEGANQLVIQTSAGVAYSTFAVLAAWGAMSLSFAILFCAGMFLRIGIWLYLVPLLAWVGYLIYVRRTNRITLTATRQELVISHTAWVFPARQTRISLDDCRQAYVTRRRTVRLPTGGLLNWYVLLQHGFFLDQYCLYLARQPGWRHGLCQFADPEVGQRVADRINGFLNWTPVPVVSTWYQRFPLLEATNDDKRHRHASPGAITASSFPVPAWSFGCLTMMLANGLGVLLVVSLSVAVMPNQVRSRPAVMSATTSVPTAANSGSVGRDHPLIGRPAPPIKLARADGTTFPWESHCGQEVMILGFFNGTDQSQRQVLAELATLSSGNVGPKAATCTVCTRESGDAARPIWQNLRFPLDLLVDADGTIQQQYQIDHWPCVFVVDAQGVIRWHQWGDTGTLTTELRQQLTLIRQPAP